jgi:hypothetical protein
MVLRYVHVSGPHIETAMAALDRTIPEPKPPAERTGAETDVTQELHTAAEKRV